MGGCVARLWAIKCIYIYADGRMRDCRQEGRDWRVGSGSAVGDMHNPYITSPYFCRQTNSEGVRCLFVDKRERAMTAVNRFLTGP